MSNFSTYKPAIESTNYPTLFNGAMDELDARFNTAATFSGAVTVGAGSGDPQITLNGGATGNPFLMLHQNGAQRGFMQYVNATSDLQIGLGGTVLTIDSSGINAALGATTPSTLAATTGSFSGLVSVGGSTPASAGAAGVAGTVTWDANFLYVCTATNTWERVAIASW